MALTDYFLTPLGLTGLVSLVGLVILYLVSQRPTRLAIPTIQFLTSDPQQKGARRRLRRLQRALLLILQALVLIGISLALATPYVAAGVEGGDEAALVVDASASMAAGDGASRFDRALRGARSDVAATTSVIAAGPVPRVPARGQDPASATGALGDLRRTDAPGDLASAISVATGTVGDRAPIHVYSDFADDSDWRASVERARAAGHRVVLHRFGGGGADNVGIVELDFGRTTVTATLQNTGERPARRTVSLGGQSRSVTLQPGDLATAAFDVPVGGGQLRLSPGDSFPVDDVAPIGGPSTGSIRVLVLTSDGSRYLRTALSVIEEVDLRVERLPAPVSGDFDVVVFDGVDPERVLAGNLELARDTLRAGGGVIVTAQPDVGRVGYGQLLPVRPSAVAESDAEPTVVDDPLTSGVAFPPPGQYLEGTLRDGRALVRTASGAPLVATHGTLGGRVLYYGYLDAASSFPFDAGYPVFWKRAVYAAADRPSLSSLNRRTGGRLTFAVPTRVETPDGPVTAQSLPLDRVGFYGTPDGRLGASLSSRAESALSSPSLDGLGDGGRPGDGPVVVAPAGTPPTRILSLVPVAVGLALAALLAELGYLVYRGDL